MNTGSQGLLALLKAKAAGREGESAEAAEPGMSERFGALGRSASDLICELNSELCFVYVSPNSRHMLHYEPARLLGCNILCFVHPEDLRAVADQLAAILAGSVSGRLLFRCRDGRAEWRWFDASGTAYRAANGKTHIVFVSRDETQRQQLEEQRSLLESRDTTTVLFNKQYFVEQLIKVTGSMEREAAGAVIFVDLDDFKTINDCCGHLEGDRLIVQIANLLYETAPREALLARFGGDEFLLLLKRISGNGDAVAVAERIRTRLAAHRFIEGEAVYAVSASVGVVKFNGVANSREVLNRANAACASAKAKGGNRVEVYESGDGCTSGIPPLD